MNGEKDRKYTLGQHAAFALRGLKVIAGFPKPMLLSRTLQALFNAGLPFVSIYFSAQILNELTGARDRGRLVFLVLLAIGLNLLVSLGKNLLTRWKNYCESEQWSAMLKVFSDKMLDMDYVDVENPAVQQQYSDIRQHMSGMGFGLGRLIWSYDGIVDGLIKVILSTALAMSLFTLKTPAGSPYAYLDSPLAVIFAAAALIMAIFLAPYFSLLSGRMMAKLSDENNRGNRFFQFYFWEMIRGSNAAKDIRIYGQERLIYEEVADFWSSNEKFKKVMPRLAMYDAAGAGVSHFSNGLIYLFVALKAYAGAFGVGGIVRYVGAIFQMGGGFASVLQSLGQLANNTPFLDKCFEFLDIPGKMNMGNLPVGKNSSGYEIEFHNVSFKYTNTDTWALRSLNLKLNAGRRTAVVGMNGSGKTTMIKLLCRLYDPTEGYVTLNGVDIRQYDYNEYKKIFSVVFQDFKLLPFTIAENIAAATDIDRGMASVVLEKSGFGPRLDALPNGLDTYLYKDFEEDGIEVSGGEAQKIALARALYKDAPFIVLDEPTAALDPVAEFEIYSKFNSIAGGKTVIYISHRLSSCYFCDDIAVFYEGQIIQRGRHDQLLADEKGKYYELWNAQAQYYTH